MSGSIGGLGSLTSLIGDSQTIQSRLTQLEGQAATGYVAPTLGGLGAEGALQVLDLRPAIAHQTQWQANINAVQGNMSTAQSALTGISSVASAIYAKLPDLDGTNPGEVDSVAAEAKQALTQMANLLDTRSGDGYVFAGQTPDVAPVPNPDSILTSAFATGISGAVSANLGTVGAAQTATLTAATAAANSPFAPNLSTQPTTVQVGENQYVQTGLIANQNTLMAPSTGPSTTGSYMTDIMRGLATIASLSSSQVGQPGFSSLVDDTRQSLGAAMDSLNFETGAFGDLQSGLQTTATNLASTQTALTGQLSSAQDVDMAATLTSLTQTQTALQASYQVIASAKNLTLANYL